MSCQYQYYRRDTGKLQAIVNHSDESYNCEEMSPCPYTGTTIINKIPWAGEAGDTQEEDRETEESDNKSQALFDLKSENRKLRKKLKSLEEARLEAGREINKLRREVEILKSENKNNKRLLELINKISSGADQVV